MDPRGAERRARVVRSCSCSAHRLLAPIFDVPSHRAGCVERLARDAPDGPLAAALAAAGARVPPALLGAPRACAARRELLLALLRSLRLTHGSCVAPLLRAVEHARDAAEDAEGAAAQGKRRADGAATQPASAELETLLVRSHAKLTACAMQEHALSRARASRDTAGERDCGCCSAALSALRRAGRLVGRRSRSVFRGARA